MGRTLRRTAAFTALWRAMTAGSRGGPPISRRVAAIPRMIWAAMRGRYDGLGRIGLMGVATLYVVWPIDVVPELFLSLFGLVDDAFVVTWIAGAVLAETERFLAWEQGNQYPSGGPVIDGEVT